MNKILKGVFLVNKSTLSLSESFKNKDKVSKVITNSFPLIHHIITNTKKKYRALIYTTHLTNFYGVGPEYSLFFNNLSFNNLNA